MNSLRKFTSLCITFSFLAMTYTGILLFIAPKGRVANWTNWELFGLDKTQYTNLHVTFMVLFLVGMILHLYLNWKPLLCYFKNKTKTFSLLTKEFVLALGFNLLFLFGTLNYWAPFEQFIDFEEEVKSSWEKKVSKASYGHAELSTIAEFAEKTNTDAQKIIAQFNAKKLKGVSLDKTIDVIAKENGKSPAELFAMVDLTKKTITTPSSSTQEPLKEGGGYGKLSLKEACEHNAIPMDKATAFINAKGYSPKQESTLKEISEALHVSPMDLLQMLKALQN